MTSGGIIRTAKDKDHPYMLVNSGFANDERLSWAARGVMAYLLTKPDGWKIHPKDLIKRSKAGRDAVYKILAELEQYGYLTRNQEKLPGGKFGELTYTAYESPIAVDPVQQPHTAPPDTEKPDTDKPHTAPPDTEKPDVNKYGIKRNIESKGEGGAVAPTPAPQAPPPVKENTQHGTRLAVDALPEPWRLYCQEKRPDLDPDAVFENFRDYWTAQPGQKGRKADWLATWRRWVRETHARPAPPGQAAPAPSEQIRVPWTQQQWLIAAGRDDPEIDQLRTRIQQAAGFATPTQYERLKRLGMPI